MSNTFIVWNLVAGIQSLHADIVRAAVSVLPAAKWSPIARLSRTQNKCLPKLKQNICIFCIPNTPLALLPWDVTCQALKSTEFMKNAAANRHVQVPHVNCSFHMAMFHRVVKGCSNYRNYFVEDVLLFTNNEQESVGKQWSCEVGFLQTQTSKSFRCKLEKSPQCNPKGFFVSSCYHCLFSWRFLPWALVLGPLHWAQQGQRRE